MAFEKLSVLPLGPIHESSDEDVMYEQTLFLQEICCYKFRLLPKLKSKFQYHLRN